MKQLDSAKHLLLHGNTEEALGRLNNLFLDLNLIQDRCAPAKKLTGAVAKFETYIRNNQESIPNYGERYRQEDTIGTGFIESTRL